MKRNRKELWAPWWPELKMSDQELQLLLQLSVLLPVKQLDKIRDQIQTKKGLSTVLKQVKKKYGYDYKKMQSL